VAASASKEATSSASKEALPPGWVSRVYDPRTLRANAHELQPPAEGNAVGRRYYLCQQTRHAQWEKPLHRILLEITRVGYQANFAASSMRCLLVKLCCVVHALSDACYCPPVLSDIAAAPSTSASNKSESAKASAAVLPQGGGKAFFMAQSAPRIPWAAFKDVLTQVIGGVVRVDLEYVAEGREGEERPPLRIANEVSWQTMLEHLRKKALSDPDKQPPEIDVDLVLLKSASSGLLRRKS